MQRSLKCWTKLQGSSGRRKKFIITSLHKSEKIASGLFPCIYPCFKDWFLYQWNNPAFHRLWSNYTCHLNHLFTPHIRPLFKCLQELHRTFKSHCFISKNPGNTEKSIVHTRTNDKSPLPISTFHTVYHLNTVNPLNFYSSHGFYTQFRTRFNFLTCLVVLWWPFPQPNKIVTRHSKQLHYI